MRLSGTVRETGQNRHPLGGGKNSPSNGRSRFKFVGIATQRLSGGGTTVKPVESTQELSWLASLELT
jgi:hypothetical protein